MVKETMGSAAPDQLLSSAEVCDLLGVSKRTLTRWIKTGVIEPHYNKSRAFFFRADAEVLREIAGTTDTDLPTVARQSMLAYVAAKRAERRLEELSELLGLNRSELELDSVSVRTLYEQAQVELVDPTPTWERAHWWAARFFGIDEHYLRAVSKVVGTNEPWKLFIDLADRYTRMPTRQPFEKHARAYLDAARDRLRHVSYFACRKIYGKQTADNVFAEDTDVTDRLSRIIAMKGPRQHGHAPASLNMLSD